MKRDLRTTLKTRCHSPWNNVCVNILALVTLTTLHQASSAEIITFLLISSRLDSSKQQQQAAAHKNVFPSDSCETLAVVQMRKSTILSPNMFAYLNEFSDVGDMLKEFLSIVFNNQAVKLRRETCVDE